MRTLTVILLMMTGKLELQTCKSRQAVSINEMSCVNKQSRILERSLRDPNGRERGEVRAQSLLPSGLQLPAPPADRGQEYQPDLVANINSSNTCSSPVTQSVN